MKLFISYLKMKSRSILIFLLFAAIMTGTFALYRLPLDAVIYPVLLCGVAGAVFLISGFVRFSKRHAVFDEIAAMRMHMLADLPSCENVSDEDYMKIILLLREEVIQRDADSMMKYKTMTDYYTVWAHQIKTPIASMKLTLQNADSPEARRLSSELFRIEQYVEMVLAFLRLDSSSTDYVFREYDLDTVIKGSVRKFAAEFIGRKLKFDYDGVDCKVVTDEKWLSFVIEQILSNALKYTKEGTISVYMKEPQVLCIRDTGIGIDSADLPRIFENGYTGVNGRADKSASGIGLYLCRRICDSLGIKISVESVLGEGTAVTLDLHRDELITE